MPISKDIFIKKYLKSLENGDATFFAGAGLSVQPLERKWNEVVGIENVYKQYKYGRE